MEYSSGEVRQLKKASHIGSRGMGPRVKNKKAILKPFLRRVSFDGDRYDAESEVRRFGSCVLATVVFEMEFEAVELL